jgi:hypothetical protein
MRHLISVGLIVAAVIHILPLSGVLGSDRLVSLYGVVFDDPNLEILLRHRAVLFGLLGLFLLVAAFRPSLQMAAFVVGFVSVVSFLLLAWSVGGYNAQIARVFWADVIALASLVMSFSAHIYLRSKSGVRQRQTHESNA